MDNLKQHLRFCVLILFLGWGFWPAVWGQSSLKASHLKVETGLKVHALTPPQTSVRTSTPLTLLKVEACVEKGDTIPLFKLPTIWVFPPEHFKNRRQEKFYWRTVRDVKKTLPLAKMIYGVMLETNDTLMTMPSERAARNYLKGFTKRIYKENEATMKHLTLRQGKLLIKLIDRDCGATSYDLIRAYRGSVTAGFYNIFAGLFGASLKSEFGTSEKDKMIERIIIQVEAGML